MLKHARYNSLSRWLFTGMIYSACREIEERTVLQSCYIRHFDDKNLAGYRHLIQHSADEVTFK